MVNPAHSGSPESFGVPAVDKSVRECVANIGISARLYTFGRLRAFAVTYDFNQPLLKFGFVRLRYRGLKKNANQLFAVCALNLYLTRKKLLLLAPA
jgi:IS5 family transposase